MNKHLISILVVAGLTGLAPSLAAADERGVFVEGDVDITVDLGGNVTGIGTGQNVVVSNRIGAITGGNTHVTGNTTIDVSVAGDITAIGEGENVCVENMIGVVGTGACDLN